MLSLAKKAKIIIDCEQFKIRKQQGQIRIQLKATICYSSDLGSNEIKLMNDHLIAQLESTYSQLFQSNIIEEVVQQPIREEVANVNSNLQQNQNQSRPIQSQKQPFQSNNVESIEIQVPSTQKQSNLTGGIFNQKPPLDQNNKTDFFTRPNSFVSQNSNQSFISNKNLNNLASNAPIFTQNNKSNTNMPNNQPNNSFQAQSLNGNLFMNQPANIPSLFGGSQSQQDNSRSLSRGNRNKKMQRIA